MSIWFVWFVWVRHGGYWILPGSCGSSRCALGVSGIFRARLVPLGTPLESLGSCGLVWFVRMGSLDSFGFVWFVWMRRRCLWFFRGPLLRSAAFLGSFGFVQVRHWGRWVHSRSSGSLGSFARSSGSSRCTLCVVPSRVVRPDVASRSHAFSREEKAWYTLSCSLCSVQCTPISFQETRDVA